jgi:hypothetical protein
MVFQQHEYPLRRLLPALRSLTIDVRDFNDLALYPRLLIGPSLRYLFIKIKFPPLDDVDNIPWANLKAVVEPYAPGLKAFQIFSPDDADGHLDTVMRYARELPQPIIDLQQTFRDIVDLDITPLDLPHTIMHHISILPTLRKLNIVISFGEASFNLGSQSNCFPVLNELDVGTNDLAALGSSFIGAISSKQLETIRIREYNRTDPWDLTEFCYILGTHESHLQMKEIAFLREDLEKWSQPRYVSVIDPTTLGHLYALPQLTILKVTIDVAVDLTDDSLYEIVNVWHHLRVLRLFDRTIGTLPTLTMKGLLYLSSYLPLEDITLRVDCTQKLSFSDNGSILPCPRLHRLNLCTSPITEHFDHVISAFTLAFPALSAISVGWCFETEGDFFQLEMAFTEDHYQRRWFDVIRALEPVLLEGQEDWFDFT